MADETGDLGVVGAVRQAVLDGGMTPFVIAPKGGMLGGALAVRRTFATARSVEFDAVLLAGAPAPGDDAYGARDAKAGDGGTPVDPRVLLLVDEAYRHAEAVGGWGTAAQALQAAGIPAQAPGVVTYRSAGLERLSEKRDVFRDAS
ncbi:hypothetical protein [Nonomuraea sp. NPDC052265]|uniref:hypothetical protein n=1 Tax=Nonomuraea sp. NPDC052265 TaxID=3364374 RepID=UPI0037C8CE43